jgi:hypothetical protein
MDNIYRLQEEKRATRLAELSALPSSTDLANELAVLRLLQEEALNNNQPSLAMQLAKTIGRLSQITEATKIRRGELLAKAVVLNLAQQVARILAERVAGRFDGWEDAIDAVKSELLTLVAEARNPEPGDEETQPKRLRRANAQASKRCNELQPAYRSEAGPKLN